MSTETPPTTRTIDTITEKLYSFLSECQEHISTVLSFLRHNHAWLKYLARDGLIREISSNGTQLMFYTDNPTQLRKEFENRFDILFSRTMDYDKYCFQWISNLNDINLTIVIIANEIPDLEGTVV